MSSKGLRCKKCNDDKVYTPEQADEHRAWHKAEKQRNSLRTSRPWATPLPSEVTCFEPIDSPPEQPASKKSKPGGAKRKRSHKSYDTSVESVTSSGG